MRLLVGTFYQYLDEKSIDFIDLWCTVKYRETAAWDGKQRDTWNDRNSRGKDYRIIGHNSVSANMHQIHELFVNIPRCFSRSNDPGLKEQLYRTGKFCFLTIGRSANLCFVTEKAIFFLNSWPRFVILQETVRILRFIGLKESMLFCKKIACRMLK